MGKILFYFTAAVLGILLATAGTYIFPSPATAKENLSIYFFYSDYCPHCREVKPHVAELAKKFNVTYCNVADLSGKCLNIATEFKLKYVPTLVVFQNKTSSVYVGTNEVERFIEEALK